MQPHRIDVHHHILPPDYVTAVAKHGVTTAGDVAFPAWSASAALSLMDRAGIATAITSVAAPGVSFGDRLAGRSLARYCNEFSARLVADFPHRFGAFAVLPLPDVDGTLAEIEYALDTLKLDGVIMLASIGERYLGDPAFDAVFDELDRRKAVAFVHPTIPVTSRGVMSHVPGAMAEFVFDTTRAAVNLIYGGTLERCRNVSIILSHAGGTVPYIAWRIAQGALFPALRDKAPQGALAYLRRLYYDTAMSATPYALASLREVADPGHILFGSDWPFLPEDQVMEMVDGLVAYRGFGESTRAAIERGNGLALFPRLRKALADFAA
jgi:predicted TIM-barrel fold metal-dependent hydrolase